MRFRTGSDVARMADLPPLRLAILGCGRVAEACHLPALQGLAREVEVVAAVDADEHRLRRVAGMFEIAVPVTTGDSQAAPVLSEGRATHADFFSAREGGAQEEGHGPRWSAPRAVGTLVAASLGAAWMSEVLVGAAEATGHALGMSPIFLGMVLLAVIGGAAESGSAIAMGRRNKPDLAVGIAMGSSIQIALFVAPVLVLLSGMIGGAPLGLAFTRLEIGALLLGTLIVVTTSGDGQATWFKGVQLLAVYLIIAGSVFWMPVVAP